jgi:hypothetical protein
MSEMLNACKALAAMVRDHGEPTVDEVRFVAHAALELGLDPEQNSEVQSVLAEGGDFEAFVKEVNDRSLQLLLFRQICTATMIDDEINEAEKAYIKRTGDLFGFNKSAVESFVGWLRDGLEWERRGAELAEQLASDDS